MGSARWLFALVALAVSASAGSSAATFYKDILPLLQEHCQSCHRDGQIAPMPLVSYEQVRPWARAIRERVVRRNMPPWFVDRSNDAHYLRFSNDPSLTSAQIQQIAEWADAGAPAGDPLDAPAPKQWAKDWNIDSPDVVLQMPKPVKLPASGDIDYTYVIVPTGFESDHWVRMSEIRPTDWAAVHHAVVYIREPESRWLRGAPIGTPFTAATLPKGQDRRDAMWTDSDLLLVYAPGSSPDRWPDGMGKLVKAGSDLVLQMHYTSHGVASEDRTRIGLVFAKERPTKRVLSLQLTNDHFHIPPGVPDYQAEVRGSLPADALLLSFFPHLHFRGKTFTYNLIRSGEKPETLLKVDWDFHWQMTYRLAEPLPLKAGTILEAIATWDNSRNNPHNPDPDSAVNWGEQTWEEMMVGFFDVAVDVNIDKKSFFELRRRKTDDK
ncbi:MAG: cytochrome c [Bryobacteraceae bacterium]